MERNPRWDPRFFFDAWNQPLIDELLAQQQNLKRDGITRNVLLHTLPAATTIERVETFPISTSSLDVRVLLRGAATASVSLALSFDGSAAGTPKAYPVKGGVVEIPGVAVPQAKPWSLAEPNLHTLTVSAPELGADGVTVRFGP